MVIHKLYNIAALDAATKKLPRRHRARGSRILRFLVDQAHFSKGWITNPRGDRWRIDRGEYVTSRSLLAAAMSLTGRGVQTVLRVLGEAGLIKCYPTRRGTLIHITDYDIYHKMGAQQDSVSLPQGVEVAQSYQSEVVNRHLNPPYNPPVGDNIIKNKNVSTSLNSKPLNNSILPTSVRKRLFSILQRAELKTKAGRTDALEKLQIVTPWIGRERIRARAFLLQASKGQVPQGLAYKLLVNPDFSPADSDYQDAKFEEFPRPEKRPLESRQDEIQARRRKMLADLYASIAVSKSAV